jgi:DNA-binding NarL/FixJ family response regulator
MTRSNRSITVTIVDDHALFCDGIRELLTHQHDFEVVAEGRHGAEAVALVTEHQPDVVLLDVAMPGPPPHVTIPQIHAASAGTRVIVLTMHDDPDLVRELMALGACGYLAKNVSREQLFGAIRTVVRDGGRTVVAVSKESLKLLDPPNGAEQPMLTPRELEVLGLAARAMTNAQIGAALFLAPGTVKRHLTSAYRKLGAVSRIDAINRAAAAGLVSGKTRPPGPHAAARADQADRPVGTTE